VSAPYCSECGETLKASPIDIDTMGVECMCPTQWHDDMPKIPRDWRVETGAGTWQPVRSELLTLIADYDPTPEELGDTTHEGLGNLSDWRMKQP
jgi:hypothetical protein